MLLLLLAALATADETAVVPLPEPAPEGLSEAVRKELAGGGLRVTRGGKPWMDLWLRKDVPTQPAQENLQLRYTMLKPGTLVGALRVPEVTPDYRGQKLQPGAYTLRYGVQPEDGDHQGVSDFKDFLLPAPAAADSDPGPMALDALNKISAKAVGKKHPAVLYLVPVNDGTVPRLEHEAAREQWTLVCATGSLRLGIVVVGKAEE